MGDTPKLHCYSVSLSFKADDNGLAANTVTTWIAYTEAEAMGWAMHFSFRSAALDNKTLGTFAGYAIREITEDDLSQLLNRLRTGGKGAEVTPLQVVKDPPPVGGPPYSLADVLAHALAGQEIAFCPHGSVPSMCKWCKGAA